ncbi:MAG TPA: hypothetical protein VK866_06270, partial [Acidimicrobiales bacterium]|nr:hypothetical protein [Acidimicrobiales bacterium]
MGDTTAKSGRGPWALLVAAVALVGVYLWDDLIFAAPVVAASAWLGPLVAFALLAPVYAIVSWIVAMAAVRAYERASAGEPSRFATWLEHQRTRQRSAWGARLLDGGKLVGFVV